MLIDGNALKKKIGEKLLDTINAHKLSPSLGILCVGDDLASLQFINVKKKFGENYGFRVEILRLNQNEGLDTLKKSLIALQERHDGVIVQLPLPVNLKEYTDEILSLLQKTKDVDNLNSGSFEAPIVLAFKKVLEQLPSEKVTRLKEDMTVAVVGLGQVVGLPIKNFLEKENFNFKIITRENFNEVKKCDLIISGVGKPFLIKKENVKDGSALIDYGCSIVPNPNGQGVLACGDIDPECYEKASYYTPVPGCMGPLVVAELFENVLKAAEINS